MNPDKYKPKKNHVPNPNPPPVSEELRLLRAIAEKVGAEIE